MVLDTGNFLWRMFTIDYNMPNIKMSAKAPRQCGHVCRAACVSRVTDAVLKQVKDVDVEAGCQANVRAKQIGW
jgi:hypothetical protein